MNDIPDLSRRYQNAKEETITRLSKTIRDRGHLTHAEFVWFGRWKSPRIVSRCAANEPAFVEAVTAAALGAANERLRIEALTLLRGVGWPMASSILHWCHAEPYPILDYRALWSLGIDTPPRYEFGFWSAYTNHCRDLARRAGVTLRELDRALWQYSKEKQS